MAKKAVHEDILEILPWFVNESLGERERQRVLAHLRACESCRHERDQLQTLQQVIVEDEGVNANYRFAFRKLMHRIEVHEANRASMRGFEVTRGLNTWIPYAGAAACLLLAIAFVAALNPAVTNDDVYQTLSANTPVAGSPHKLALTFDQPIKAETLRAALVETRSNIVSGPDEAGTYIVEVRVPDEMTDGEFIRSIREIEGVRFAAFAHDHTR